MPNNSASINLVKSQENFIDKFIKWALSVGRLLVILTELIALVTFVYRFTLDRQLIDLHGKIVQEQTIVNYLKNQETTYRNLQDRIALASQYGDQEKNKIKIFKDVASFAPLGFTFENYSITESGIRISGQATSIDAVSSFVNSLKNYDPIERVVVDKIDNRPSNAIIEVQLSANFKQNQ